MKRIGKGFAATVFVVLTAICLVLVGYDNGVAQTGTVWSWGYNGDGELGDGTANNRTTPVQVNGLGGMIAVAGGDEHSLALKSDGTVWSWGYNSYGELGDATTNNSSTPVQVNSLGGMIAV